MPTAVRDRATVHWLPAADKSATGPAAPENGKSDNVSSMCAAATQWKLVKHCVPNSVHSFLAGRGLGIVLGLGLTGLVAHPFWALAEPYDRIRKAWSTKYGKL